MPWPESGSAARSRSSGKGLLYCPQSHTVDRQVARASARAAMGPQRHNGLYACASTERQLRPWMSPSGDPRRPVRQC